MCHHNIRWTVYDTIGLGEIRMGSVPDDLAKKKTRNFLRKTKVEFDCILYIIRQGSLLDINFNIFKIFKKCSEELKITSLLSSHIVQTQVG